ncbi:MAG TPA: beta-ketoacyl synthase chain length factor [Cytophagales bacterium]|nr:beta-ketoacyl synthase chain length factor [Cytophagales bacterium]
MFYIHQTSCISPQQTFSNIDIEKVNEFTDNKMYVSEPAYDGIPAGILRRMGKAVRIGVGAALPLIKNAQKIDGIVIGTANGGLEDCIKFLNQIIQYEEGTLTPTNFVQSTANAIASQISLLSANKGYNVTHVHRGLAFENALIDVDMLLKEKPQNAYLLGGVDEISVYNYNIQFLSGQYKKELISNKDLYQTNSEGSIAGEGAAMFLAGGQKEGAIAKLDGIKILHAKDEKFIQQELKSFLKEYLKEGEEIDLFLSGENGDARLNAFYSSCESLLKEKTKVARYKHMTGEHQSASAISLWIACNILQTHRLPSHMVKIENEKKEFNKILLYNTYGNMQHSFMLLSNTK